MEAQQCAREPTGTNGPTLNNTHPPKRGACTGHARNHYTNHDQPTPPTRPPQNRGGSKQGGARIEQQNLWWSQHRGNAQPPFRTWKLSPAAPMVLQPTGCGRVGHRHNTPKQADRDTPHQKGRRPGPLTRVTTVPSLSKTTPTTTPDTSMRASLSCALMRQTLCQRI